MSKAELATSNVYAFPRLWDAICAGWGGEDYFASIADEVGGPVLELAVGTGRLLEEVAKRGHDCTGLDLAPEMIACCRKRLPEAKFVEGNMLDFNLGPKFRTIFIGNNSIQYLQSAEMWGQFLAQITTHLEPGGEFSFSMSNPRSSVLRNGTGEEEIAQTFIDPASGEEMVIRSIFHFNSKSRIGRTVWTNHAPDGRAVLRYEFRLWYPSHRMVLGFMKNAGFDLIAAYGSHDREPFTPQSRLQVCRFRKSALPSSRGARSTRRAALVSPPPRRGRLIPCRGDCPPNR
jgi:SAM-dependent methyltransferase